MGEQTKHLGDEIANTEGETTITVDGETIGLRQASVAQGNEPDRARRARIQEARLAATAEHLNPLLDTQWRRCHDLALELGYPDYKELYGTVRGLDYDHLRAELEGFLADTESLYERVMDRLVRERLGVTLAELQFADLPYLWRAEGFDPHFKADALVPSLRRTLAGMGIDLDAQPNVHLDTEVRELKSPRAFCSPVRVPDEIYLVALPHGGQDDYGMLLHEAGHTEHFAHVRPDLAFEYRHLGDNAVTEGFAFTFDHLLLNRRWLADILEFDDSDDYVRFAAVNDLYFMRRYAAKLAYETTLHAQTGSLEAMPAEYSRRLTQRHQGRRCRRRTTSPTSTTASTAPATCAPGCSRARCASCCRRTSAWTGTRRATPATGSRRCGPRASTSRPSGCCCGTAAGGSTPTRCGTCSSRCSGADPLKRRPAQAGRNVTSTRRRRGPSNSAK